MKTTPKKRGRIIHDNLQGIYNLTLLPDDSVFSKLPCDGCKDKLFGNRHKAIGTIGKKHNTDRIDLLFCEDCALWLFS